MKRVFMIVALVALTVSLSSCVDSEENARVEELNTFIEQYSYAAGMNIAESLKRMDTELNIDLLEQGLRDAWLGESLLMTMSERDSIMMALAEELRARDSASQANPAAQSGAAAENLAAGEAFLAENATKDGVIVTASGLQYKVIEEGEGEHPGESDRVTVNYKGMLIDGTEFDSSYGRGQPATFPVNGVIRGWIEGLQLMKVGGKYEFFIPANLAYGQSGAGPKIGPNSTLVFEVELLSIERAE